MSRGKVLELRLMHPTETWALLRLLSRHREDVAYAADREPLEWVAKRLVRLIDEGEDPIEKGDRI